MYPLGIPPLSGSGIHSRTCYFFIVSGPVIVDNFLKFLVLNIIKVGGRSLNKAGASCHSAGFYPTGGGGGNPSLGPWGGLKL